MYAHEGFLKAFNEMDKCEDVQVRYNMDHIELESLAEESFDTSMFCCLLLKDRLEHVTEKALTSLRACDRFYDSKKRNEMVQRVMYDEIDYDPSKDGFYSDYLNNLLILFNEHYNPKAYDYKKAIFKLSPCGEDVSLLVIFAEFSPIRYLKIVMGRMVEAAKNTEDAFPLSKNYGFYNIDDYRINFRDRSNLPAVEFPQHIPWWAADLHGLYKILYGYTEGELENPVGIFHENYEFTRQDERRTYMDWLKGMIVRSSDVKYYKYFIIVKDSDNVDLKRKSCIKF